MLPARAAQPFSRPAVAKLARLSGRLIVACTRRKTFLRALEHEVHPALPRRRELCGSACCHRQWPPSPRISLPACAQPHAPTHSLQPFNVCTLSSYALPPPAVRAMASQTVKGNVHPGELTRVEVAPGVPAYVVGDAKAPAVIVLQEW